MSEDKSTGNDLGVVTGGVKDKPKKRWLVVTCAVIVVVLALAAAGMWWWASQRSATTDKKKSSSSELTRSTVCDNAVIQSVGRPISDNDMAALQPIVDDISKKKNYRGDVNCNYILMRYYLMIGDVPNAQQTMDDLLYTHGNSGGYSTVFDPPATSPSALRDALGVMIANKQEAQKQDDELNGLDQ